MVGEAAAPSRPPATIEDFLWNMHQVLSAQTSPLAVDAMKDAYSKHLGHKCNIEKWLVVSGGDLGATLKRIPHVVTIYQSGASTCIKATQSADITKEGLVEKDLAFRKELMKKSAAAKSAKAGAPPATGTKASGAEPTQAKAPVAAPKAQPQPAETPGSNGHAAAKKAGGPTRPPSSIEDFLWNIHCVLENSESPMPIESLTEAYSKHLGHKFAIERFLVVGDAGLVATLKRIPHVVTVKVDGGSASLTPTLPKGSTKESLVAADQAYRKTLQQKSQAAAKAAPGKAAPAKAAPATTAPAAQKRPAEDGAESEAKRSKPDDKDKETLSRMLVQGVCKVLQNRATTGKGPLLISSLAEEFKTHWKVPFNLQSAGYSDVNAFLKAWPNKLEVANEGTSDAVVSLVKKTTEKAKAEPAAKTAPAPAVAPEAAKKAAPAVATTAQAPPAKATAPAAAEDTADVAEPEAKKPRGEDQDTLSRMLVQGVVRVLQNRAKEGKGALLLSELPEEFKTLWKVPFNLQSAGFSDVNAFVKAWTNKLEVSSTAEGDVVALVSKKSGDKAKVAAAKSGTEVSVPPKSPPASSAKAAVPVAESSQGSDLTASAKETTNGDGVTDGIPQSASEIQKELHKNALELDKVAAQQTALVARQLALIEAMKKLS